MRVSYAPCGHNYRLVTQNAFGGINNNIGAEEGEIFSALNMSADNYPVLSTRKMSYKAEDFPEEIISNNSDNVYCYAKLNGGSAWIVKNTDSIDKFVYIKNGIKLSAELPLTNTSRQFAKIGNYLCIYPDRVYFNCLIADAPAIYEGFSAESGWSWTVPLELIYEGSVIKLYIYDHDYPGSVPISAEYLRYWHGKWMEINIISPMNAVFEALSNGSIQMSDGTLFGEAAEKNTLRIETANIPTGNLFDVGDAVKCTIGTTTKTAIIREIEHDQTYTYLRFFENTFADLPFVDVFPNTATSAIEREIPELEFIIAHNNRLWGCNGRQIYASHLGNPLEWYDYESTADSAWAVEIAGGEFTGAFKYKYPLFFTENEIYTILGEMPDTFAISNTPATYGCAKGSEKSFAVVGGYLFYHSPYGFVRYSGSLPQLIDRNLGTRQFSEVVSAAAGPKYYASCKMQNEKHTFVYDINFGIWHDETNAFNERIKIFEFDSGLLAVMGNGVYKLDGYSTTETSEYENATMPSSVEFAPISFSSIKKKQVKTIYIRHDIEGELKVKLFEDGIENMSFSATLTGKGVSEITGRPERSDEFQLKLSGTGQWKVFSIAFEYWEGSSKQ